MTCVGRMAYVTVNDGQNGSAPAILRILVTPVNDGPILRFSPSSQPPQFASLADRSHSIIYIENGSPVAIFPMSTILIDVDSFFAGNATLSFSTSRPGDIIFVNETVASGLGVTIVGSGWDVVYLSGVASLSVYLEVRINIYVSFWCLYLSCNCRYCVLPRMTSPSLNQRESCLRSRLPFGTERGLQACQYL